MTTGGGSTPTWTELDAAYKADHQAARTSARALYASMLTIVLDEIERTGADIKIMEVGGVLPKTRADRPLAMRMDVTGGTAVFARQPHVRETEGEKHRSWPIDLASAPHLPAELRDGLIRAIAKIADLQSERLL